MVQATALIGLDDVNIVIDVALFAEAFYPRASSKWDLEDGACIASACVASDVFRKLGYRTRPLPVISQIDNPKLLERYHAGDTQGIEYTQLIIGDPRDTEEPGRWKGHIAALIHHPKKDETFILDASLRQAKRDYLPYVPDLIVLPVAPHQDHFGDRAADIFIAGTDHDSRETRISYWLRTGKESETWKTTPDAQVSRRRMTVKRIVAQITKRRRELLDPKALEDIAPALDEVRGIKEWTFVRRPSEDGG